MICSKFITFAVTKTTKRCKSGINILLWFAQNSLPLRWQRQLEEITDVLLNVVICSKFITFAVTKTTINRSISNSKKLWFAQNSLPLRWQRQQRRAINENAIGCDLLKIHYLCGDKDNLGDPLALYLQVVICSKFITFAVTKTTKDFLRSWKSTLWFAQNSLPLRWQRQQFGVLII